MISSIARRASAALLVLVCLTSAHAPALAQAPRQVAVALVPRLSDSAAATIVRSPGADGATLVMLRAQVADAATLGAAMRALSRSRQRHGDTLRTRLVIKLYRGRSSGALPPEERRVADRYFARLRGARPRQLDGVGLARVVQIPINQIPFTASR